MIKRRAAPMKAMITALMIGWPATATLKWRKPASTMPPNTGPTMPTTTSQRRPRPWPRATWLAKKPATSPTRDQTRIESRSSVIGVPLTLMTITNTPPLQKLDAHQLQRAGASRHLGRQCGEGGAEDAVERRERVDHVGQVAQRSPQLHRQNQLAQDLPRARRDKGRPHHHAPRPIGHQLQRPAVKVVDVPASRLGRVDRGHHDVKPMVARDLLGQAD